ncbi:MAG: hypothetical protein ACKVLC_03100, partial [Phycisphaerales bacterium]
LYVPNSIFNSSEILTKA